MCIKYMCSNILHTYINYRPIHDAWLLHVWTRLDSSVIIGFHVNSITAAQIFVIPSKQLEVTTTPPVAPLPSLPVPLYRLSEYLLLVTGDLKTMKHSQCTSLMLQHVSLWTLNRQQWPSLMITVSSVCLVIGNVTYMCMCAVSVQNISHNHEYV